MKLRFLAAVVGAGLLGSSAFGQETKPLAAPAAPPDKEKLSYAMGMNLGERIKNSGADVDISAIAQAIKDVLGDKVTQIQESDIRAILKQAETYGRLKEMTKNVNEGETFLEKNTRAQGVKALPGGLQYRVIKEGTGELPRRADLLTLKFKGTWIDGTEFNHNDALEIPFVACTKGLQEALSQMKVGSEWQVFIPSNLGYGRVKDRAVRYGSLLIYDIELVNAEKEGTHPNQHHGLGGRVGHSLDEDLLPPLSRSSLNDSQ